MINSLAYFIAVTKKCQYEKIASQNKLECLSLKKPFQHSLFVVYLFVLLLGVGSSAKLGKAGKTYKRKNTLPYLISKLQANKKVL